MAVLVIADHDGSAVRDTTNKTVTAALALSSDVDVLVVGENAKAAADRSAPPGVRRGGAGRGGVRGGGARGGGGVRWRKMVGSWCLSPRGALRRWQGREATSSRHDWHFFVGMATIGIVVFPHAQAAAGRPFS